MRVWDWQDEQAIPKILRGHGNYVLGVAFSPEGQWLASSNNDRSIMLWDTKTLQSAQSLKGHQNMVFGLQFLDNYLLALPVLMKPFVYGMCKYELNNAHDHGIVHLAFNSDGTRFASSGVDGLVKVWKIASDGEMKLEQQLEGHIDVVHAVAFSAGNLQLATASYDGHIGIFSLTRDEKILFEAYQGRVASVNFDASGKQLLSAGDDSTVKLWNWIPNHPPQRQLH